MNMAEIKIQCPTCKYHMTVQGNPGETVYVTCPQCKTYGRFTIPRSQEYKAGGKKEDIVVVNHLRKIYQKNIVAVDDISFSVQKGEIFGFLGPNGAGKSTTSPPSTQ